MAKDPQAASSYLADEALVAVKATGLLADLDEARVSALTKNASASLDALELARRHWLSLGSRDDALLAPGHVSSLQHVAALANVIRQDDSVKGTVVVDVPGRPARVFVARTYGSWVRLCDIALEAVGDGRRMTGLVEPNDDVDEMVYVLATPAQRRVLEEVGWADDLPPYEEPEELSADGRATEVAASLTQQLERRGITVEARATGTEVTLALTPEVIAALRVALHHERRKESFQDARFARDDE